MTGYHIGIIFLVLVLGCWAYVIGHQLGFDSFKPEKYPALEAVRAIAYTGAGMSVCFLVAIILMAVKK